MFKKLIAIFALLVIMPSALAYPAVVQNNSAVYNRPVNSRTYTHKVPVYEQVPLTRYFCSTDGTFYQYDEEQSDENCFYQVVYKTQFKEYKEVQVVGPYYGNYNANQGYNTNPYGQYNNYPNYYNYNNVNSYNNVYSYNNPYNYSPIVF